MAWEPDYVTRAEFKAWAGIKEEDTTDDVKIDLVLPAACRAVDRFCSQHVFRQFGKLSSAAAFYYTPRWDRDQLMWVAEIDDLMDTTGITIEVDTSNTKTYTDDISSTGYILRPQDAIAKNRPYTQVAILPTSSVQPTIYTDCIKMTAPWGWTSVPSTVKEASMLQTNRINKRRTTPYNTTGNTKKGTQITTNLIDQLDKDIEVMLEPFVKIGWTV
jgi:hypothetical protein